MAKLAPKLFYISSQFRVKVELSKAICESDPKALSNLIQRAERKLETVRDKGDIDFFVLYKERIQQTWKKLLESKSIDKDKVITITLGLGGVRLKGTEFKANLNDTENPIDISIVADASIVSKWPNSFIRANVDFTLQQSFKKVLSINCAQVQGVLLRAKSGLPSKNIQIARMPDRPDDKTLKEKPFVITVNKSRKEITLIILSYEEMKKTPNIGKIILDKLEGASKMLKDKTGVKYTILKKGVIKTIQSLEQTQELLDVEVPMSILAGIALPAPKVESLLKVKISKDKMRAIITGFNMDIYSKIDINEEWLTKQLKLLGLSQKSFEFYIPEAIELVNGNKNLDGLTIAQGNLSKPNEKPYLYETYKYASKINTLDEDETKVVDIRDMQQTDVVKAGSVVAEICYVLPGDSGQDVFGNELTPANAEEYQVDIGKGIQRQGDKFIALNDGTPIIDEKGIRVHEIFVHNGDVNLRTGNINFDGPLEINGSVDNGATVISSGDIKIRGDIRGTVISKGNISCSGGIITGEQSIIEAKGSITTEFIENSVIHCAGNLNAKKVILNSQIISGGDVSISDQIDGVIAGGVVSCLGNIKTNNLGFQRGAYTQVNVGVDWKIEKKIAIKRKRKEKLQEFSKGIRLELRELVSKRSNQMTAKHSEMKNVLQKKLVQSRKLIDMLEEQLKSITNRLAFNMKSKIYVEGIICSNVKINIGGNTVNIPNDLAGVAVMAKKKRGSHIIQIEEAKEIDLQDAS